LIHMERQAQPLIIATLACTTIGFVVNAALAPASSSVAMLGNSLEHALMTASGAAVLWCFWWGRPGTHRDDTASLLVSFCLIGLAGLVGVFAVGQLVRPAAPDDTGTVIALSLVTFFVFMALAIGKCWVGYVANSSALRLDAVSSLSASLAALGSATGAAASAESRQDHQHQALNGWWVDAVVSVVVAAGLLIIGLSSLAESAREGSAFWRTSYWKGGSATLAARTSNEVRRSEAEFASREMTPTLVEGPGGGVAISRPAGQPAC